MLPQLPDHLTIGTNTATYLFLAYEVIRHGRRLGESVLRVMRSFVCPVRDFCTECYEAMMQFKTKRYEAKIQFERKCLKAKMEFEEFRYRSSLLASDARNGSRPSSSKGIHHAHSGVLGQVCGSQSEDSRR